MNIRGFLKWQFSGWYKDLTLWGMVLGVISGVAAYLGCPKPVPMIMLGTGIAIIMFDLARSWFRFSYALYRLEQTRVMQELKQREL